MSISDWSSDVCFSDLHGVDSTTVEAIGEYPQGRGLLGEVIIAEAPVRLADLSDDPRAVGFPPGHPTMRTFLGVPLLRAGRRYGNLYYRTRVVKGQRFEEVEAMGGGRVLTNKNK